MTDPTCTHCDRPIHDGGYVCRDWARALRQALQLLAQLDGEATITVARLARARRGPGRADDLGWERHADALEPLPLPLNLEAARRYDAAVGELAGWARHVAEARGIDIPGWHTTCRAVASRRASGPICARCESLVGSGPLKRLSGFLAGSLAWLRRRPEATEAWPAMAAACAEIERVIDSHIDTAAMIGMCRCGMARYEGDRRCRRCREVDLAYDRQELDARMPEMLVTAAEAAAWVAHMGLVSDTDRLRKLIWAWADRGHIQAIDDVPRYRFGDVLTRVMASPALLRAS